MKQPTCLSDAFKMCVDYALQKHRMNTDRIADAMGLSQPWSLYKYISHGSMPCNLIRPFELACKCNFVTAYLAASTGEHVLIKVPNGRRAGASDIAALQETCNLAVNAVIQFYRGKGGNDAAGAIAAINTALGSLSHERGHIQNHQQPEFNFHEA